MNISFGHEVIPLFSSPLYSASLAEQLDSKENKTVLNSLETIAWSQNSENEISYDTNWLDSVKDSELNRLINYHLNYYFYNVLSAITTAKIYITESWVNKTVPGGKHHRHRHPNSIISGVYYFNTTEDSGNIIFSTHKYSAVEYETSNPNIYNSKIWSLTPKAHTLLLFPSDLEHTVSKNTSNTVRYSLSFNTFVSGEVSNSKLAKLHIW